MDIRVGNKVIFTQDFYGDPHYFVPVLEDFQALDELGVSSGKQMFSDAIKESSGVITKVIENSNMDILFVTMALFGKEYPVTIGTDAVVLTPDSILDNHNEDERLAMVKKIAKLKRREELGQMRMFD